MAILALWYWLSHLPYSLHPRWQSTAQPVWSLAQVHRITDFSLEIKNNGLASDFCLAGEALSLCGLDNLIELILSSGTFFVILHAQSENYQIIKNIYTRF